MKEILKCECGRIITIETEISSKKEESACDMLDLDRMDKKEVSQKNSKANKK